MAQLLSLYSLQQYLVLLPRYLCLLYHNIPQNLHFLIFNNNFWSMFIPFFNSFQVVFPTQFSINYSCNIAVPSLVLILFQLFAFAHNMRHCFPFLVTHSTKWWLGCSVFLVFHIVCSDCLFLRTTQHAPVSTYKSAFLSQYHVSFSIYSFVLP